MTKRDLSFWVAQMTIAAMIPHMGRIAEACAMAAITRSSWLVVCGTLDGVDMDCSYLGYARPPAGTMPLSGSTRSAARGVLND